MASRKFDWRSPKGLAVVGGGAVALLLAGYGLGRLGSSGDARQPPPARPAPATEQPVGAMPAAVASNPVPLTALDSGSCKTFAPEGWRITDQNKDGTVLTAASPDGKSIGSYGGVALSSAHAAGAYGDQFRTPESTALFLVQTLTREAVRQEGEAEPVGVYRAIKFSTASHSGYALLYRFDVPADPGGYGVILRIAIGAKGDMKSVGVAGAVAAATRCSAVLHPSDGPVYEAPRSDHDAGRTGAGSDADMAGTYNAQLGTGWVHDDSGRNYNVDVTADWRENGPDGPGFYKQNGNDVTKLTPGLQ